MSYAAERWARSQTVGNASAKAVLIELANSLNKDDGRCFPSVEHLEAVTELNRKTIIAATKLLEDKGLVNRKRVCENGRQRIYYSFPLFVPSEWEFNESPENGTLQNPNIGTLQNPKNGTLQDQSPKNGTKQSAEIGTLQSPKNGTVTGNKNREIEQGNNTDVHSDVFHADVSDLDLFDELPPVNDSDIIPTQVEIVSEQKRTRKPSDQRKRSSPREGTRIDPNLELPDEWREICERLDPDLDPNLVFDNFKNYWLGVSGKGALKADWKATWRNCVSSYRNAPDWKRNPMLKKTFVRKDPNVVQAKVVTHELTQEQRKKIGYGICYD